MNCESCEIVGIKTNATTTRKGERVCAECALEIDARAAEEKAVREDLYDSRGVRKSSSIEVFEYRDEDGVWVSQACDNSGPIRYDGWLI